MQDGHGRSDQIMGVIGLLDAVFLTYLIQRVADKLRGKIPAVVEHAGVVAVDAAAHAGTAPSFTVLVEDPPDGPVDVVFRGPPPIWAGLFAIVGHYIVEVPVQAGEVDPADAHCEDGHYSDEAGDQPILNHRGAALGRRRSLAAHGAGRVIVPATAPRPCVLIQQRS